MRRRVGLLVSWALCFGALAYPIWLLATLPTGTLDNFLYTGDYEFDADPALRLALSGHIFSMYSTAPPPLMLPVGLLVRLPSLAVGTLAGWVDAQGASLELSHVRYLWGALGALVLSAITISWFAMARRRQALALVLVAGLVIGICWMLNPLIGAALRWGHIEEAVMAALMAAAFLALADRRIVASAVLAALALAVKQPAVLIVPALFLSVPVGERKRFAIWYIGTAILAVLPFIAADLGAVLQQNRQAAGAFEGSKFFFNIYDPLGLGDEWKWTSRPIIFALAVAIPALFARNRRGWRLPVSAGLGLACSVMLIRCLFDPYNIVYYAAPAASLAMAWELLAYRTNRHPLQRFSRFRSDLFPVPVVALAASGIYSAFTHGFGSELIAAAASDRSSWTFHALLSGGMTLFCISWARKPFAWLTPAKLRGLFTVGIAGAVLLATLAFVERSFSPEIEIEPPAGYEALDPVGVAEAAAPAAVYWLGEEDLLLSAYNAEPKKPTSPVSMFQYGDTGLAGVTVYSYSELPAGRSVRCEGTCPKTKREIETPLGPGLVTESWVEGHGIAMDIQAIDIRTDEGFVYVDIVDSSKYPTDEVLAKLRLVPERSGPSLKAD